MRVRLALYGVLVCVCLSAIVSAQDAVKVDAKHYTVVSENDQVRILKVHYGPHEKSIMHSHPATVAVFLTDGKGSSLFRTGRRSLCRQGGRYTVLRPPIPICRRTPAALDLIVVELKGKSAKP